MRHQHGMSKTPEYRAWAGIKQRCFNVGRSEYGRYGGRGITMCKEWTESFPAFFAHIGPRPSPAHSVDRIDGARGYEPGNVRWATPEQQAQNHTIARPITFKGRTLTVSEWARETGIGFTTLIARLNRDYPLKDVFSPTKVLGRGTPPIMLEHDGKRLSLAEWGAEIGISKPTLKKRLKAGIPLWRALREPMPPH